jgi:hypothetical protein
VRLQLPWIPAGPQVAVELDNWQWGVRAAQRALFLQLDLLRERLSDASAEQAETIFAARRVVDAAIATLEAHRQTFTSEDAVARTTAELAERDDTSNHINALRDLVADSNATVVDQLRVGTRAFYSALHDVDPAAARDLFGLSGQLPEALSDTALEQLLDRSPPVWAMWICLLLLAACIALPAWRAHQSDSPGRPLKQWSWAVVLALCGGLVAIIAAIWKLGFAKTLIAAGAFTPNKWVIADVLFAAGLGTLAIRQLGKLGGPLVSSAAKSCNAHTEPPHS